MAAFLAVELAVGVLNTLVLDETGFMVLVAFMLLVTLFRAVALFFTLAMGVAG